MGLAAAFLIYTVRTSPRIHDVAPGDTLFAIASRYYGNGVLYRPIAESNGIQEPYVLTPGTTLMIPGPSSPFGDFSTFLLITAGLVVLGLAVDVPAFSAAERLVGGSGNALRAFIAAGTTAVFTSSLLFWGLAAWGFAGKTGALAFFPVLWMAAAALALRALSPVYNNDLRRTTLTWGAAKIMSGSAVLLFLLLGTAFTGERIRPFLATLSVLAPR